MEVTHADHEDWDEKTANSPEAEQCCAKKVSWTFWWDHKPNGAWTSRDGSFTSGHPLVFKAYLLVTNQSYSSESGGLRDVRSDRLGPSSLVMRWVPVWLSACEQGCVSVQDFLVLGSQSQDWGLSLLSHRSRWGVIRKGLTRAGLQEKSCVCRSEQM